MLAALPCFVWGADMICGALTGKSLIDMALTWFVYNLRALKGYKCDYMLEEGFSFYQFTSNSLLNAVGTILTFVILGTLMSGCGGLRSILSAETRYDLVRVGGLEGKLLKAMFDSEEYLSQAALLPVHLALEGFQFLAGVASMVVFSASSACWGSADAPSLLFNLFMAASVMASLVTSSRGCRSRLQFKEEHAGASEELWGQLPGLGILEVDSEGIVGMSCPNQGEPCFFRRNGESYAQHRVLLAGTGLDQRTANHIVQIQNNRRWTVQIGEFSWDRWQYVHAPDRLRSAQSASWLANEMMNLMFFAMLFVLV